ncbi:T-cell immunomodulatory protein-like [Amphiura filiformis]|uniref:T-cell immunomodulatory protein-like n=1 Tax=Amphiura filiformis TaxID=82378 RepID=UPI003B223772
MKSFRTDLGRIWVFILPFLSLITCDSDIDSYSSFSDVTNKIFGRPKNGTIAAFGDFNSDQYVDIFFIVNEGHGVEIFLMHIDGTQAGKANIERPKEAITSVVPGDFNGDSLMDVLITTRPDGKALDKSAPTSAYVYWGPALSEDLSTKVSSNMIDQPLVMDYNADMIPDIFGAEMDNKRYFWICNNMTSPYAFTKIPLEGEHSTHPFRIPNSNAFVDMLGSGYAADLFVTSMVGEHPEFEVWLMQEGPEAEPAWTFRKNFTLPEVPDNVKGPWAHVGQSTFVDIDADGQLDHILPLCADEECLGSYVYSMTAKEDDWKELLKPSDLELNTKVWGFVPPSQKLSNTLDIPLTLRAGDVNLDNYPDFVCILQEHLEGPNVNRAVVVLRNYAGKILEPAWPTDGTANIKGPVMAAFIDATNTGLLDVIVVNQPNLNDKPETHILGNQFSIDAYFVTVQVLSGLVCTGDATTCPNGKYTYGVNQPGPQIHYDTTSSNGGRQKSMAAQLCQSSYFSLQLPHVVMGLGQNPNFVDYLTVGVPSTVGTPRQRQFTAVIPNSQLIVIPKPLDKPQDWTSKLLITPGQSVVLTGAILIGTCIFIAIVAAVLQFLEKREDEIQKRQESHRFHFDAM